MINFLSIFFSGDNNLNKYILEKYIQIIYFINSLDIHPQIKEQATSFAKLVYHNPDSNFPLDNHSQ